MNQPLNLQQLNNDLHWTSSSGSDKWEQQQQASSNLILEQSRQYYHYQQQQQPHQQRPESWEWENPTMLLAHNGTTAASNALDMERKAQAQPGFIKPAAAGFLHSSFSLNTSNSTGSSLQQQEVGTPAASFHHPGFISDTAFLQQQQPQQQQSPFGGGILQGYEDLRTSLEQRRRLYGLLDTDPSRLCEVIKQEDLYAAEAHRIGLNLGVRTYFSSDDTTALARLAKRPRANSPGALAQVPLCQAQGCKADLSAAKHYHRRHKVCELHSKAATVTANGQTQRFCQQCSRFHILSEFDEGKRSCRKRLADHNRRRRKPQPLAAAAPKEEEGEDANGTAAEDKHPPVSPATSSDSKTGSADSLQLRTSNCTASTSKIDNGGGAHSSLLPAAAAGAAAADLTRSYKMQQGDEYAGLSLSSGTGLQSKVVPWLKPPEAAAAAETAAGVAGGAELSGPSRTPLQNLLSVANSEWGTGQPNQRTVTNFHTQQQIFDLLENPLAAAAAAAAAAASHQQAPSLSENRNSSNKSTTTLTPFGSSMFQSM